MSFGAYMTVQNATGQDLTVSVSDVSGMQDNGDEGSWLSRFNTTIGAGSGFPAGIGQGRGQYIETSGIFTSYFTLTFAQGGAIGSVTVSEGANTYAVAGNTAPGRLLVSINNSGAQAIIVVIVMPAWSPASWLTDLPGLSALPIGGICMPASHDSGAWTTHTLGGAVTSGTVLTQRLDMAGQLAAGARYFDVRPALANDGQLYHGHGAVTCALLSDILSQASSFAAQNPREVLFINFSHMDGAIQQRAWDQITNALGARLAPAGSAADTLGSLQGTGRNVVIFFDGAPDQRDHAGHLWNPDLIDHWNDYANSNSVDDLATFITGQVQVEVRASTHFWLLQCQLTPSTVDAVISTASPLLGVLGGALAGRTVLDLADGSRQPVQQLLDVSQSPNSALAQRFARTANFFMVDAIDPGWTQMAVVANLFRLM